MENKDKPLFRKMVIAKNKNNPDKPILVTCQDNKEVEKAIINLNILNCVIENIESIH